MTDRIVTALITGSGPLQGAEVRIAIGDDRYLWVDVRLDAIGEHPARWVPLQDVDQYLADLDPCTCPPGMWHHAINCPVYIDPDEESKVPDLMAALEASVAAAKAARKRHPSPSTDDDPLAEVAASHADRAAARTERRTHDAG